MSSDNYGQLAAPLYSPAAFNQPCFSDRILRLQVSDGMDYSGESVCEQPMEADDHGERTSAALAIGSSPASALELHVSRGVLAQASRFFLKLFSSGLRESGSAPDKVVTLQVASHEQDLMVELIRFCYERIIPSALSRSDLLGLMPLADRFEVVSCVEECCRRLQEDTLTLEDSITFLSIADSLHHHPCVRALLGDCAAGLDPSLWNFDRFKDSPHFLSMPLTAMVTYLRSEALVVQSEQTIFSSVIHWAESCFPEEHCRVSALSEVLPYVRYALLDAEFLRSQVIWRPEFQQLPLLRLLNTALLYNLSSKATRHKLENEGLLGVNWYMDRKGNRCREQGLNYVAESPCLAVYSIPQALAQAQRRPNHTFALTLRKAKLQLLQQGQAIRSSFSSIAGVVSVNMTIVRNKLHRRDTGGIYVMLSGPLAQQHFQCWVGVEGLRRVLARTSTESPNTLDMGWHDFFSRSWVDFLVSPEFFSDDNLIVRVEIGMLGN